MMSPLLEFYIENYGTDHIFWAFYVPNLIFGAIAYKLGFARKLPLMKSVFVYIMLAVGMFVLNIFGTVFRLPITESLIITSVVLAIYRFRLHMDRKQKRQRA
ncbi:YlaH-like family protein [Virgibacillus soli]|uniref:YlaH-like family protein n=1 Tax=Paracerasibacillus soli TaxID=480284 RepID=A0ABU5CPA0_9BACI|nr:YlaH-like family protein [Virgibacillus soli]MDY0408065.1 YlaH-like family protein [Virgibacillus soli]